MKGLLLAPMVLASLLGFATQAPAACRWFGTQLECDLGRSQLWVGTQVGEPAYAGAFRPPRFHGGDGSLDERAMPEWMLQLELQNVGTDPGLCRKLGNETYCY